MEKLVKFRHYDVKGIFHYDLFEGHIVVLSRKQSTKIDYIKKTGAIDITFQTDTEEYQVMGVDIINDPTYVQKVYDHFQATGNAYFNEGIEGLCVLRFHK